MATNSKKVKNSDGNLDIHGGELNNGPGYRLSNRRQGTQSFELQLNDLSDDGSNGSNCSSSDEDECEINNYTCKGDVDQVKYYECEVYHYFCETHRNKCYCPIHPEEPRKPGY